MTNSQWISVKDRPLFTKDDRGNWVCTEDGDGEFMAAVPYTDTNNPNTAYWWVRHCVIDGGSLCVVCDDNDEPSGWGLEDVTHWMPIPEPPKTEQP